MSETSDTFFAKPIKTLQYTFVRLLLLKLGLREKFVGIADNLFLKGFRRIVLQWKRQILALYSFRRQSCASVAFCHASMARKALSPENGSANQTVTDVVFGAKALDARSIGSQNAYIVKHGCLIKKLPVEAQLGVSITNLHAQVSHLTTVG